MRLGGVTLPGGVGQAGHTSGKGNMVRDLVLCQVDQVCQVTQEIFGMRLGGDSVSQKWEVG